MGGESRYEIAQNAYVKLVLHALKHKASAVNGVLLGRVSPQNDVVEITDSVPLFHSHIGLLPQLEISLILIEEHYAAKGVNIVGYFHANERFDDYELGGVAKNIGDHIYRYFPQAAVLLLDNKKLEALPKGKDRSPVMQSSKLQVLRSFQILHIKHKETILPTFTPMFPPGLPPQSAINFTTQSGITHSIPRSWKIAAHKALATSQ